MSTRNRSVYVVCGDLMGRGYLGSTFGKAALEMIFNWARLMQKIYEVDPLTCPKCSGVMRVISFIEDEEVIKKILKHLGLWNRKQGLIGFAGFRRKFRKG